MNNLWALNTKKLFLLIILLAGVLRLWGIWHGYPYSYYPDEAHFVKRALSFGSGDFNPHWFHKPAFYMYVLFFEYGLYFLIGKIAGIWSSISDFAVSYIKNPGPFYLIGRFTTILFSLGSIWVVYKLGERHFKKGSGIVAALLLSLSYGHVAASQNIKADTPAMFFVILSMFFLLNYLRDKKRSDLIWTAAFAGMGTATKAYPIVMLLPIVIGVILAHSYGERSIVSRQMGKAAFRIGIALAVFSLFYFVCSPYNFIDPLGRKSTFSPFFSVVAKISPLFGGERTVGPGDSICQKMGLLQGAIDYLRVLMATTGMGITIAGVGILGMWYLLFQLNKQVFLFLLYPILFIAASVLTNPGYAESRHQLPVYPFLAITGAALIVRLGETKGLRTSLVYIGLIVCLCYPFFNIVNRGVHLSREDTRNMAKAWIEANIPSGTRILMDESGPKLLRNKEGIQNILQKAEQADQKGQFTAHYASYLKYQLLVAEDTVAYDLHEIRLPWWRESQVREGTHYLTSDYDKDMGNPLRPVGVKDYDYYVKNGFEYAIVASYEYKSFLSDNTSSKKFPAFARFYRELFDKGKLIKEFSPNRGVKKPGPEIKILRFTEKIKNGH